MNDNKHENSSQADNKNGTSNFEKQIEKGVIEVGKAIDICVEKVNDFAKSEKGQKIKSGAKTVMTESIKSMKELGRAIKNEFDK